MECPKCPKYERCTGVKCKKLEAELNRATYGQKKKVKTRRRKEIPLIYEHQLSGLARIAYENIVYAGGEMPEERA